MSPKVWWKSKTALTSIVAIVVGAAAAVANVVTGQEVLGLEEQGAIVLVVVGAIFFVLRFWTKESISL